MNRDAVRRGIAALRRRAASSFRIGRARTVADTIAEADRARDEGRWRDAAGLYVAALGTMPDRAALHVQAAHMFKEARDFDAADRHYSIAQHLAPRDADLALQIGHFNKTVDRLELAEAAYRRAVAIAPGWAEPARELASLARNAAALDGSAAAVDAAVPAWELLPGPIEPPPSGPLDEIIFRRLGARSERTPSGVFRRLSGVEAIRGVCFSDRPLVEAAVLIDGSPVHREAIIARPVEGARSWKAVFNLWLDVSATRPGFHRLDIVLADASGWTRRHAQRVVVAPPEYDDEGLVASDALVVADPAERRDAAAWVRSRPSEVRSVSALRPDPPARILVLRIDQLGDLVVSVPALRRLRTLFPAARIVGLLGAANVDLARSLGLLDEVIVADVPDDAARRRRTMTADHQHELAERLASEQFDVAIDLSTSDMSRPLLKLASARFTFGFDDDASPWLDGGLSGSVRDRYGAGEASLQSTRILALVERLGLLFAPSAPVVRRAELDPALLVSLGLVPGGSFVVLHAGARVSWSRWSGFAELARALLARHAFRVVLLTEGTDLAQTLPPDLRAADRLVTIDRRLPFDQFDALLSFATAFVGNDSGPKHLAALRGTPVVAIHCARINWAEWSQEQAGVVVGRRLPCAGCAIFHDPDECGKDVACVSDITVAEVLGALESLLTG